MKNRFEIFRRTTVRSDNGSTLILRPALPEDAHALNAIVNDPKVNEFLLAERPVSLQSTRKTLKESKGLWIVAEVGGEVAGSVSIRLKTGRMDITCGFGIAFSRKAQGKGIAEAAMKECLRWMKENGTLTCTDYVFETNSKARKFYKKLGFNEIAIIPNQVRVGKKVVGTVVIQKKLGASRRGT